MNTTKTILASLAFGLVSASSMAVEAARVEVPATKLDRMEIRAQLKRVEAVEELARGESYGTFSYATLHGRQSTLTRAAVIAEMSLPKWQAFIAAPSATYNGFRGDADPTRIRPAVRAEAIAAVGSSRANARLYAGG